MKINKKILTNNSKRIKKCCSYILKNIKKRCVEAEISINNANGIKITTRYGKMENVTFINSTTFKIVVYQNDCMGSSLSTNLNKKSLDDAIDAAISISKYTSQDNCLGIADKELLAYSPPDLNLFYNFDMSINKAIKLASRAELSALAKDKKIKHTEESSFSSFYEIKTLCNTKNMLESYFTSNHVLSTCVVAEQKDSMERDYFYSISRDLDNLETPEKIGEKAAERAIARLSPSKLPTMTTPIIFAAEVATSLFLHLSEAINGFNIYNNSSCLINSLQKKILPTWLSIEENPHIISGLYSAPFDNEGIRTKSIKIVEDGILKNFLLTNYSSRRLGLKNNGHAGGIYNWNMLCKKNKFDDLLKQMNNGLLITEIIGNGINVITGDYSRGASGFWIKNGMISHPVSEITISGNLKNIWNNIIAMSNDIEHRSSIRCGSILLSEICISGK